MRNRKRISLLLAVLMLAILMIPVQAYATGDASVRVTRVTITAEDGRKELCLDQEALGGDADAIYLTAEVLPVTHSGSVTWSISNPAILALSEEDDTTCTVVPLATGYAYVKAKAADSTVTATYRIDVRPLPTQLKTNINTQFLPLYKSRQLSARVYPTVAAKALYWDTSDPGIVSITETGVIKGMAKGNATITVSSSYDAGVFQTIEVVVIETPLRSVTLDRSLVTLSYNGSTDVGGSYAFRPTFSPTYADVASDLLEWSSNNENIATIDENGVVTATGIGATYIFVKTSDGHRASCRIIVKPMPESIQITGPVTLGTKPVPLAQGKSITLKAIPTPKKAAALVVWHSSNEEYATVTDKGVVKAVVRGNSDPVLVTITAQLIVNDEVALESTFDLEIIYQNVTSIKFLQNKMVQQVGDVVPISNHIEVRPSFADKNDVVNDITYTSSYEKVARIVMERNADGTPILDAFGNPQYILDDEGNVQVEMIGPGNAVIRARSNDGGYTASCTIRVLKPR